MLFLKVTYLIQGKLRPNFEGIELGIGRKTCNESDFKISWHITVKKIEDEL